MAELLWKIRGGDEKRKHYKADKNSHWIYTEL